MKPFVAVVTMLFIFQTCLGQDKLIAKQYQPIKEVSVDLDEDGMHEKIVVYNMSDKEDKANGINREIIIFKKRNDKWIIWQRSANAVGIGKDGGMMGDPFEDVEIKNGLLLIHQSGGSSWK